MAASPPSAFRFPVYQIDFSAVAAGKRVAATKRRIRWRFGFPNREALQEGRTGTDCRGEEHEVVIVWSVTSGKRQVMMDGKEVHYSTNRTGILDHTWSTRGNHVMKVVCHAAPPMSANPNFRQYDLFIDGQSFFTMPKVYELGLRGRIPGHDRVPGMPAAGAAGVSSPRSFASSPPSSLRAPRTTAEEEEDLQRAINASLEESRQHLERRGGDEGFPAIAASASVGGGGDLLALDGPPAAAAPSFDTMSHTSAPPPHSVYSAATPQASPYGAPPPQQYQQPAQPVTPSYPSSNAGATSFPALPAPGQPSYAQPPPAQPSYAAAPPPPAQTSYAQPPPPQPAYGQAAPPPPTQPAEGTLLGDTAGLHAADDPFAPKPPTHNDIANEILSAYSATSPASTTGGTFSFESPTNQQQPPPQANGHAGGAIENGDHAQQNGHGSTPGGLSMNALAITAEKEPDNPFDKALQKLVNIDHIDQPAEEQLKLTMKKQEDEMAKKNRNKSRGLPPAANKMVGSQATLTQISQVKPQGGSPKEGIMNAPPQLFSPEAAAAGMLVVHGQHNPMGGGPPPLQPQGFGVGYRQAYGQQQPPSPQYPPQQAQPYQYR